MKELIPYYIKLFLGLLLIFPLVHAFFALDHGLKMGGIIAGVLHMFMFLLGICLFNYLEQSYFGIYIPKNKRNNLFY